MTIHARSQLIEQNGLTSEIRRRIEIATKVRTKIAEQDLEGQLRLKKKRN